MADDLSLLFKIRGDAAGAKQATAEARAAISQLRQSSTTDLKGIQTASTASLGSVTQSLSQITASIPGVGRAFSGLSSQLAVVGEASTETGASIAALAGPIGIAVAAMVVMTGATLALGKGLFSLAESAAEFRGKLFDLSQQTGISVETLSALEIVAKTTGSSIEQITASLGIFQKHLEDAQDPTSKQAKLLAELGVSTHNTEQALRDTLTAVAAMPAGFHQTATALELFGRGGKSILAILKETNGDLDGAIARFRELGLTVSTEDARAADEFNDQLALLSFQFRALLGKDVIPAALAGLKDFSDFLKENKEEIDTVGRALGTLATIIETQLKISFATSAGIIREVTHEYSLLADAVINVATAAGIANRNLSQLSLNAIGGAGGSSFRPELAGGGDVDNRTHQPLTEREKEIADARKKIAREAESEAKRAAAERKRELEQQLNELKALDRQLTDVTSAYLGLDTATKAYAVTQSITNGELAKASDGLKQMALDVAATIDQVEKDIKLRKEVTEFVKEQAEAAREALEGQKSFTRQAEEFIDKERERGATIDLTTEAWIRFNAAVLDSKERLDRYAESLEHIQELQTSIPELNLATVAGQAGAAANAATVDLVAGADAAAEANLRHLETVNTLKDAYQGFASSLGSGVGQIIQSLVLMGKVGPDGFRKVTAAALASVSARAAADAIYELAIGFAALTPWGAAVYGPAGFHFHAAALLGGIALGAGAAGRVAAGNLFSQGSSGSSSSGGSGSRAGNGGNAPPSPIDLIRPQQREELHIFVHSEPGPGFPDNIINTVIRDVQRNGPVRDLIVRTSES